MVNVGVGGKGHRISGYIYGRGLVSEPAISLKKSWGGYRKMTQVRYYHAVALVVPLLREKLR